MHPARSVSPYKNPFPQPTSQFSVEMDMGVNGLLFGIMDIGQKSGNLDMWELAWDLFQKRG